MMLCAVQAQIESATGSTANELRTGGPIADIPDVHTQHEWKEYVDDVNGGMLDPKLTAEARSLN